MVDVASAEQTGRSRLTVTPGDMTQAAVFAALIAALGLPGTFTIGPSGVPITLQTLGVMLAGSILGPRKGALAVGLFAILAIAGLPILAGARSGLVALASPTAGFFVGWLPAVIVIGALTAVMMPRYRVLWGIVINVVGGMAVIYAFGTAGLMLRTDLSWWAALSTNGIYLPGDVAKAVVTAAVAAQVHRARPGLIAPWRKRRAGVPDA
ncbi:biotin transporter BioY [Mycolicibacterium confluentis]|uniref:Biotin transporter n=1 Tax=Mycolicibacterium confluentis TaxID=28047 RepID=A0A7I7Y5V6_9MYCO|nr:biotin transporter BioY [Mycolicibacterium confluentis]MCV7318370.1 biotin transporter BioY [Mycolicibacterium confluentis]ORV29669.1 biotin biosynthesis protein BioY [Mycolicibacterium confluentis]BBZ36281.1 BioY family transporter [Mycolicibacterium confluentis]